MQAFEITVLVEDVTDKFILRQFVGEGSFDGMPVQLDSSLPEHSPMVYFRGRQYLVNIHAIVKAICGQAPPAGGESAEDVAGTLPGSTFPVP